MADDARTYIQDLLERFGLGSEVQWAWDRIVAGDSQEYVVQQLRERPSYQTRFSGMAIRQQQGLPAVSEAEYISYERQAYQLMRNAGMPSGFYDEPTDYADLIGKDVSVNELNQRISNSYLRVKQAPESVRTAFNDWFGINGDSALAAYFLDPDRAQPILERQADIAEIGGAGRDFGLSLSQDTASQVAATGVGSDEARRGFGQLSEARGYFDETVSETENLTAENEGTKATFGVDGASADAVRRRKERRTADFTGSRGAPASSQGGVIGAGSTQR